jgi:hypothetical protein
MKRQYGFGQEASELRWLSRTVAPLVATAGDIFIVNYEDWFDTDTKRAGLARDLLAYVGLPSDDIEGRLNSIVKAVLNRNMLTEEIANPEVARLYAALKNSGTSRRPSEAAMDIALNIKVTLERFSVGAGETFAREKEALTRELLKAEKEAKNRRAAVNNHHTKEVERLEAAASAAEKRIAELAEKETAEVAGLKQRLAELSEYSRRQTLELKRANDDLRMLKTNLMARPGIGAPDANGSGKHGQKRANKPGNAGSATKGKPANGGKPKGAGPGAGKAAPKPRSLWRFWE